MLRHHPLGWLALLTAVVTLAVGLIIGGARLGRDTREPFLGVWRRADAGGIVLLTLQPDGALLEQHGDRFGPPNVWRRDADRLVLENGIGDTGERVFTWSVSEDGQRLLLRIGDYTEVWERMPTGSSAR
jgi:hypothetical protein